jgi:hypothetical protein
MFTVSLNIALKHIHYTILKMTEKRAINLKLKGRSVLSIKPIDIHCEVCDIYMGMVKCFIGLFVDGLLNLKQFNIDNNAHLKDAARQGNPATVKTNKESTL